MYKSVSFNIYELNLQDLVYKNRNDQDFSQETKIAKPKMAENEDTPIPKPIDDFWNKPLSSGKNKFIK